MSSKDKTGAKLVASIRKSKTGTVASKTSERPDARATAEKPKASTTKPVSKTTPEQEVRSREVTNQGGESFYSSRRRVWPD